MPVVEAPWDDCKVAFGIENEDAVWRHWSPGSVSKMVLPAGWSLCETDCSGARCVAIFRVEGAAPNHEDGERVLGLLRRIRAVQRQPKTVS